MWCLTGDVIGDCCFRVSTKEPGLLADVACNCLELDGKLVVADKTLPDKTVAPTSGAMQPPGAGAAAATPNMREPLGGLRKPILLARLTAAPPPPPLTTAGT